MSIINPPVISPLLFGRNQELEIIRNAFGTAAERSGQCLLISGDAGIGKSRLVNEAGELAVQDGFQVLRGACFEQDIAFPYGPWIDALRQFFAHRSPEQIGAMLGEYASEIIKLTPELAPILPDIQPTPELTPEAEKRRLFEAVARFIAGLAAAQPLLIIIEDLHWVDETSLDLLHALIRRFTDNPIALIATYRSESPSPQLKRFLSQVNRERLATEIRLNPLTRLHVAEMIRAIFKIERPVKLEFLDMILSLTGGNPFFVEEVLKSLVESGGIYWENGAWERRPVVELQPPHSIRDAVLQRVEPLSPAGKELLTLMAVSGRHCSFDLLQALTGLDENSLIQQMKELIDAQLVSEVSADLFAFRHELTRESVYAGLMQRERRVLHRRIAETVEGVFADSVEMYLPDLALHYYQSGQWEKARQYARQAGEKAQALYSPREAQDHFNRAIEANRQLGELPEIDLHRARGLASRTLGDFDTAYADFQACLQIAKSNQDPAAEWQALLDLGLLLEGRDYGQAGTYNQQALAVARQLGDQAMIGHTLNRLAIWYSNMNRPTEGYACVQEALQIFERLDDHQALASALVAEGNIFMNAGNFEQGSARYIRAIPLFQEQDNLQGIFECYLNLGIGGSVDLFFTEPPTLTLAEAARYAEHGLKIARQMASRPDEAIASIRLSMILRAKGDFGPALELSETATQTAEELDHAEWISFGWAAQGEIQRDLMNLELAKEYYQRALNRVEVTGNLDIKQTVIAILALVYIQQNQLEWAEQALRDAGLDKIPLQSFTHRLIQYGFARLALAQGSPEKALGLLDEIEQYTRKNAGPEGHQSPYILNLRGEALTALGRDAEGRQAFEKALAEAEWLGELPLLWRIHLSLARLDRPIDQQRADQETERARAILHQLANQIPAGKLRDHFLQEYEQRFVAVDSSPVQSQAAPGGEGLTAREMEVAALIGAGKSNQEIADALVLSKRTVEKHISNILSKLMLTTRAQIVVWALERGIVKR